MSDPEKPSPPPSCCATCGCEATACVHTNCGDKFHVPPPPSAAMSEERFRLAEASDPACPMHSELYAEARRARAAYDAACLLIEKIGADNVVLRERMDRLNEQRDAAEAKVAELERYTATPVSAAKARPAKAKRKSVTVEIVLPPISDDESDDEVSRGLRRLTERLSEQGAPKSGGFLGGEFGYGCNFENEVFVMHPFCWCEEDSCPWCNAENAPNFLHKRSGFRVNWYKYIGRGMEIVPSVDLGWNAIIAECFASIEVRP